MEIIINDNDKSLSNTLWGKQPNDLTKTKRGLFTTLITINGSDPIEAIIDTGSDTLVLPEFLLIKLIHDGNIKDEFISGAAAGTAGGPTPTKTGILRNIEAFGKHIEQIDCSVPQGSQMVLFGMNALRAFDVRSIDLIQEEVTI